jgi:CrcB protein
MLKETDSGVEYLMISIGGILGANARYLLANWATQRFGAAFPYGTFIINTSGAVILGFFMAFSQERVSIHSNYRLVFATGFCGAYTTFSTLTFESLRLFQDGSILLAFTNLFGSILIGMLGVFFGFVLGRLI